MGKEIKLITVAKKKGAKLKGFKIISMSPFPGSKLTIKGKALEVVGWGKGTDLFYVSQNAKEVTRSKEDKFFIACQDTGFVLENAPTEKEAIKKLEEKLQKYSFKDYEESKSSQLNYCRIYESDLAKALFTCGLVMEDVQHFKKVKEVFKHFKIIK